MPRRSSSPSLPQKKIFTLTTEDKKPPATITPQNTSFIQIIKEGIGFGIGSSIGNRVVGAIMGPTTVKTVIVETTNIEYEKCMKEYDDKAICEKYNK